MAAASRLHARTAETTELARGALRFDLHLSAQQLRTFGTYVDTLLFWRAKLSLTGAATAIAIVRMHLLDSLSVARFIEPNWKVADLGSGAGFPGIPLAITRPQACLVLVESRRRRANFLREVVRRCRLTNVEVLEQRVGAISAPLMGRFDAVVSRAVWPLPDFLDISAALVRSHGLVIAMKGPKARAEASDHFNFSEAATFDYELEGGIKRVLLVFRRT